MEEVFEFLGETQRVDKQHVAKEGRGAGGGGLKGTMKRGRRTYKSETTSTLSRDIGGRREQKVEVLSDSGCRRKQTSAR